VRNAKLPGTPVQTHVSHHFTFLDLTQKPTFAINAENTQSQTLGGECWGEDSMLLLTVEEAADCLRLHRNTIYKLIRSGILVALKVGTTWKISESSVMEFKKKSGRMNIHAHIMRFFDSIDALTNNQRVPLVATIVTKSSGHLCPRGLPVYFSQAYLKIIGFSEQRAYDLRCADIYHPDDADYIHGVTATDSVRVGEYGKETLDEIRLRRADRKYAWVRPSGRRERVGNITLCVATIDFI